MKRIKKPISILLSLMMVVGLFSIVPITASAEIVTDENFKYRASGNVYTIENEAGWQTFCENVKRGESFSGKTVKLSDNIGTKENPVTISAGSYYRYPFSGTFNGSDWTMYFEGSPDDPVPFPYLAGSQGAPASVSYLKVFTTTAASDVNTVAGLVGYTAGYAEVEKCSANVNLETSTGTNNPSNLYTAGLISQTEGNLTVRRCIVWGEMSTNGMNASGLVGIVNGTADIENCKSAVTIKSSVGGEGRHGGLVGMTGQTGAVNLTGCLFNGKLLTTGSVDTGNCGGIVGWMNKSSTITDCVYAPDHILKGEKEVVAGGGEFPSGPLYTGKAAAVNNCYYTRPFGSAEDQGRRAYNISARREVTLSLSGEVKDYNVSYITYYATGFNADGSYYACEGDEVTLTLDHTTPTGYSFSGYTASAGTLENGVLTMPAADVEIGASFVKNDYGITVAETEHGSVTAPATAHYRDTVTLNLQPDAHYALTAVTVTDADGNEIEVTDNQFIMPASAVNVSATFDDAYPITVAAATHGTVTAPATARYNDTVTLNIQPDENYELKSLTVTDAGSVSLIATSSLAQPRWRARGVWKGGFAAR